MARIRLLSRDAHAVNSTASYTNGIASGLCIGAVVILGLCIYLFRRRLFRLLHTGIGTEPEKHHRNLLTETQLQSLPTKKRSEPPPNGQDSCSICTEALTDGALRQLPCDHEFHTVCVDPWLLKKSATCPLCRSLVSERPKVDEAAMPSRPRKAFMKLLRREPSSSRDVEAFPILEANTRTSPIASAPQRKPMPTIAEVAFIAASASSRPSKNQAATSVR